MGVYGGISLPNINEQSLDDRKERKQILNYLAMLDEKLRYMFQNIDIEDNFSEGAREYVTNIEMNIADNAKIMSDMNGHISAVEQTANGISSRVAWVEDDVEECFTLIEQTADRIGLIVSGDDGESSLELTESMIKAVTETFVMCGEIEVQKENEYGSATGGYIGYASGNDGVNTDTAGVAMSDSSGNNYVIATTSGVRMTSWDTALTVMDEQISASVEITTGSDRNIKNSIDYDMSRYEEMFMELKPCGYRYNSQPSGGIHLGFIAQEVEEAAPEGFGGVVKGEHYSLGYNNFIALNTHMIQKLMTKVTELENKLEALS